VQPHLDADVRRMRGDRPVRGEQRQPQLPLTALLEGLDAAQPRRLLAVVDLAEVQHVAIHRPPVGTPALLRDAPVPMLLAVFDPAMALEVHCGLRLLHAPGP
jgi:hypothetical protein